MKYLQTIFIGLAVLVAPFAPNPTTVKQQTRPIVNAQITENENSDSDESIIQIGKTEISIEEFSSAQLDYSIALEANSYTTVLTSKNPAIATVEPSGQVNALKAGDTEVNILVLVNDSNISYTRDVKIKVYSMTGSINFKESEKIMNRGSAFTVEYSFSSEGLSNRDVVWTSSNPSVATVIDGKVTGVDKGKTTIKASIGSITASMEVTVIVPLSQIEFNPRVISLEVGQVVSMPTLVYVPYDTTEKYDPVYRIENDEIATLTSGKIRALQIGRTVIHATIGSVEAVLEVNVTPQIETDDVQELPLTVLKTDATTITLRVQDISVYQGQKYRLTLPNEIIKKFIESTENSRIAIVLDDLLQTDALRLFMGVKVDVDVMEALKSGSLEIAFVNPKDRVLLGYRFSETAKTALDLRFVLQPLEANSTLSNTLGAPGYELIFYNDGGFPSGTRVIINPELLGDSSDKLHFLYYVENDRLVDTNQEVRVDERSLIQFDVSENHYIVAFNRIGSGSVRTIIMMLSFIVFIISGVAVYQLLKRVKNNEKL